MRNSRFPLSVISLVLLSTTQVQAFESHDSPLPRLSEGYEASVADLAQQEEQIVLENSGERRPQIVSTALLEDGGLRYEIHGGRELEVVLPRIDLRLLSRLNIEESTALVVSAFRHLEEFDDEDFGYFENKSVRNDDLGDTILKFDQYIGDRRVAGRGITIVLGEDGSLHSFTATPVRERELGVSELKVSDADARRIFAEEYGKDIAILEVDPVIVGQPPVFGKRYSDGSGARELTVSNNGEWVQFINTPMHLNGPCSIQLRRFIRVSNGQVSHYRDDVINARSETITCTGKENVFGSNYTWKLQRDPMIDWVLVPGLNEDIEITFGAQFPPTFDDPGNNFIEQRSVFYALNQMRFFTTQNMYSQYPPVQADEKIHPRFGYSWVPARWGRYNPLTQQLDVFQDAADNEGTLATAAHEYGHHVQWRYATPGNACTDGVNEQLVTQESVADLIGLLFWLDDGQVQGEYGSISPSDYALGVTEHWAGTTKDVTNGSDTADCPSFESDTRDAFEQAMWEIMFNRNCSIQACYESSGHGSYLYYNQSREQVLTRVGDALAYAIAIEGYTPTFQGLVDRFITRTYAKSGSLAGNRVLAVFVHHGFY